MGVGRACARHPCLDRRRLEALPCLRGIRGRVRVRVRVRGRGRVRVRVRVRARVRVRVAYVARGAPVPGAAGREHRASRTLPQLWRIGRASYRTGARSRWDAGRSGRLVRVRGRVRIRGVWIRFWVRFWVRAMVRATIRATDRARARVSGRVASKG